MASERRFAEVRKALEAHGWTLDRIRGSHHVFRKEGEQPISVPVHGGRVKAGYVRRIEKALGIKV